MLRGDALTHDGEWESVPFLVDTGADRTVFSAAVFDMLGFESKSETEKLAGVGGVAASRAVTTRIRFLTVAGTHASIRGKFAAFSQLELLDISVLGRDILDLFALIVHREADLVALLRFPHHYAVLDSK